MDQMWLVAALWLLLALVAVLVANWLRVSTALSEIVVGTVAQLVIGALAGGSALGAKAEWITFLAGTGAIVLTFLAGAELDPEVFRAKWKESSAIGLVGFVAPFLGATLVARYVLGWGLRPSLLAGVALSTTSVAVVYAVMLELGFNRTKYGKAILAACFINDLGTVIALGLIFSPFTIRTFIFLGASLVLFLILPFVTGLVLCQVRRARFGTGNQIPAVPVIRPRRAGGVVRQRSGPASLSHRNGARGDSGQRPLPDPALADLDVRVADSVLLHPRGQLRFRPRSSRRAAGFRSALLREDGLEAARPATHRAGLRVQRS
jgi:hypothetical protein